MPTYDYVCPKCGHQFEQFQPMSAAPLTRCPKCRKSGLKRLVGGGAGLIFKGSGFYITDYKKSAPPKETGDSGGKGGEAKPAPAKAEKPAAGDKPKSASKN